MTEEIIVNGFDVSECCADNKMMKDGLYCFWEGGSCEDNEYCYYKECRRLEQENEAITKDYEEAYTKQIEYANDVIKLTQALEEIKNCINTYTSVENDFVNSETYLRIMDEINECIGG